MNIPRIGFGCSPFRAGGTPVDLGDAVRTALECGYRLFDLAEMYGNERRVGAALDTVPRGELFVAGKAWRTNHRPADLVQACEDSLRRLRLDAFDLYLIHAPGAWLHVAPLEDPESIGWDKFRRRLAPRDEAGNVATAGVSLEETWEAMRGLARRGLAAEVGVSNFEPEHLAALEPAPRVNQIACSPYEPNRRTREWCVERGIRLMAHSPLSASGLLADPRLAAIAKRAGCTPAVAVLRWCMQQGLTPLPSSANPAHIRENLRALDGELDADALGGMEALAGSSGGE